VSIVHAPSGLQRHALLEQQPYTTNRGAARPKRGSCLYLTPGDVRLLGQPPLQLLGDVAAQAAECGWGIFTKQQFVQVVLRGLSVCLWFLGMVMLRFPSRALVFLAFTPLPPLLLFALNLLLGLAARALSGMVETDFLLRLLPLQSHAKTWCCWRLRES
jgi:hypothetical protein